MRTGLFAAEGAVLVHILYVADVVRLWPPLRAWHHSGFDQVQAREERGDLRRSAQAVGGRATWFYCRTASITRSPLTSTAVARPGYKCSCRACTARDTHITRSLGLSEAT